MPTQISQVLKLPYIQPSQAQKHVTHNEALRLLDVLVQLVVSSRTDATPPATPPEGRRHIVPADATGGWAGQDGNLAVLWDGDWIFLTPLAGWQAYVKDEDIYVTFQSGSWDPVGVVADNQNLDLVGVNTMADMSNRLAVASDNTLLTHDGDDHRLKVNKAGAGDTASLLFQSNFTGLAEMGAIGAETFSVRVSDDGSTWKTAMSVDGATAKPDMLQGLDVSGALTGTGVVGIASEQSGVSTGAIIESGSNINGTYTRWADGTQICTDRRTSSSTGDSTWTFPATFADTLALVVTASHTGTANALFTSVRQPSVTDVDFNVWNTSNNRITGSVGLVAFGRWY